MLATRKFMAAAHAYTVRRVWLEVGLIFFVAGAVLLATWGAK